MIGGIKFDMPSIGGIDIAKPAVASPTASGISDFATHLAETLKAGESAAIKGVTGEMPLHQTVEKVLEAERTLTATLAIRDKIVSAYLEISRMQI